jgi:hypothetical protein
LLRLLRWSKIFLASVFLLVFLLAGTVFSKGLLREALADDWELFAKEDSGEVIYFSSRENEHDFGILSERVRSKEREAEDKEVLEADKETLEDRGALDDKEPSADREILKEVDSVNSGSNNGNSIEESSQGKAVSQSSSKEKVLPYTFGRTSTRLLRAKIKIKNIGDTAAENIRLEAPLLGAIDSPYQKKQQETFSHEPVEITNGSYRTRTALIMLDPLPGGAEETITIDYILQVRPLKTNFAALDPGQASVPHEAYLLPSAKIESDHPLITKKAAEITAFAEEDDLEKAKAIYEFVLRHLKYDRHAPERNKGALAALQSGKGVCEEYAALFVALARASGIPARQVNGYADPQGTGEIWNIPSGQTFALRGYRHSWAEFYLAGIGWVPVDPAKDTINSSFKYFGSLPQASHFAQNYLDKSLRVRYQGGKLAGSWDEELVAQ